MDKLVDSLEHIDQQYTFHVLIVELAEKLKTRSNLKTITRGYMRAGFKYETAIKEYARHRENVEICWIHIIETIINTSVVGIVFHQICQLCSICDLDQSEGDALKACIENIAYKQWVKKNGQVLESTTDTLKN